MEPSQIQERVVASLTTPQSSGASAVPTAKPFTLPSIEGVDSEAEVVETVRTASPVPLTRDNLRRFARSSTLPTYLDKQLEPGIVHFGAESLFARTVLYPTVHRALEEGRFDKTFGICAVAVARDSACQKLRNQEGLYTIVKANGGVDKAEVVAAVTEVLAPTEWATLQKRLARAHTVTLNLERQDSPEKPVPWEISSPRTPHQMIVAGLYKRFESHEAPFIVLSFDQKHPAGEAIKNTLMACVAGTEGIPIEDQSAFAAYVQSVACPDTAVYRCESDRKADETDAEHLTGFNDALAVKLGGPSRIVINTEQLPPYSSLRSWIKYGLAQGVDGIFTAQGREVFDIVKVPRGKSVMVETDGIISDVDETVVKNSGEAVHDGENARYCRALCKALETKLGTWEARAAIDQVKANWFENFKDCMGLADWDNARKIVHRTKELIGLEIKPSEYLVAMQQVTTKAEVLEYGKHTSLVDGIVNLLQQADLQGIPVVLCTSSPRYIIGRLLKDKRFPGSETPILDAFEAAVFQGNKKVGPDTYSGEPVRKAWNKVHKLRENVFGQREPQVVMIGDSVSDVMSAALAGVKNIIIRLQEDPTRGDYEVEKKFRASLAAALKNHPELTSKVKVYLVREFGQVSFYDRDTGGEAPSGRAWSIAEGTATKFFEH